MSAEILRRAAALMRRDAVAAAGDVDDFLPAAADWLEDEASEYERYESIWAESHKDPRNRWGDMTPEQNLAHHFEHPLAVARAYLGSDA